MTRSETTQSLISRPQQQKLMVWFAALLFFSALHALGLLFQVGGETFTTLRGDLLNIPPSFFAAWIIFSVSRTQNGVMKSFWFWLSLALLSLGVADCVWAYLELVLKLDPFPSLADIFYLLQPMAIIAAFSFVPRERTQTKREKLKFNLEISIVMTALLVLAWRVYLANTVLEYGNQYLALLLSLIYPVLDVLQLLSLSLLMFNGRGRLTRVQFTCLALGLAGMAFYDVLFNIQEASSLYITGNPLDLLNMVCAVLFSIAAISSLKPEIEIEQPTFVPAPFWKSWRTLAAITQIAVVIVFAVNVWRKHDQAINEIGVLIGTGVAVVLALMRQSVELYDNSQLNNDLRTLSSNLEVRVQERTTELNQKALELNAKTLQLEQSQAQVLAIEKLTNLGRFTASVAHEINTPLASSLYDLSYAQKLVLEYKNSILTPTVTTDDHLEIAKELEESHTRMARSLERLGRYIRRVREQSRISLTLAHDFDARLVLRDAFVQLEYQASEHQVKLEIDLPDETIIIHGDPQRLSQVLKELVQTGIDCANTQEQISWVRITLTSSLEEVTLSVQDNGCGFNSEDLSHLFEPMFFHTDHGDGLGLSVIRDIVQGHFVGDLQIKSQVGQGTQFQVRLPKAKPTKVNV